MTNALPKSENVSPTKTAELVQSKPVRHSRRSKVNDDSCKIDEPPKPPKDSLDAELEATEAEMNAVLRTMMNTKKKFASDQGEVMILESFIFSRFHSQSFPVLLKMHKHIFKILLFIT